MISTRTIAVRAVSVIALATAAQLCLLPASGADAPAACAGSWAVLDNSGLPEVLDDQVSATGPGTARVVTARIDGLPDDVFRAADGRISDTPAEPTVPMPLFGDTGESANVSQVSSSFDGDTDGWVVGSIGSSPVNLVADHWSHGRWTFEPLQPSPDPIHRAPFLISGVAAITPTNAWAVGTLAPVFGSGGNGAFVQHWNGQVWSIYPNPFQDTAGAELNAIRALSPTDIWAVGDVSTDRQRPLALHWNGHRWAAVATVAGNDNSRLIAISADGPADVWAVGAQNEPGHDDLAVPFAERFDGSRWIAETAGLPHYNSLFSGVFAAGPDDVWATERIPNTEVTGRPQRFHHWDGHSWTSVTVPNPPELGMTYGYESMAGTGPGDIWAVGTSLSLADTTLNPIVAHYSCSA